MSEKKLTFKESEIAYQALINALDILDTDTIALFTDLLIASNDYSAIRSKWSQMSIEEKHQYDQYRTNKHNNVIITLNVLERYMNNKGDDTSWRHLIGSSMDGYERKQQGDFACYISYNNAMNAR